MKFLYKTFQKCQQETTAAIFSHASVSLGFCLKYQLHRKEEQEDAAMEAERG
jgi:hypothetical protein